MGFDMESARLAMRSGGIDILLKCLNRRTPHRFTGLFLFQPPLLKNIALADSWNQHTSMPDSPIETTLCALLHNSGESFVTDDTRYEPRVAGVKAAVESISESP